MPRCRFGICQRPLHYCEGCRPKRAPITPPQPPTTPEKPVVPGPSPTKG